MKTIFNKNVYIILTLAFIFALSPASNVLAVTEAEQRTTENQPTTLSATLKNACTKAINMSESSDATVLAHVANMKTDFASRLTSIDSKQSEVKQKITAKRAEIADRFQAKIAELRAIEGLSDEQIAAIDLYEANMTDAEAIRETAIDKALAEYQVSLSQAIKNHQDELLTATTTFENTVAHAFSSIKEKCTSGTDISALKATIKEARQKLVTARQSTEHKDIVKQLQTTRNTAIKAANDAFKKSAAEYKATLMKALEIKTSTNKTE